MSLLAPTILDPIVGAELTQLDASLAQTLANRIAIVQIVTGSYATQVTNNTNVWATTGLKATLTRKVLNSSVLVYVAQNGLGKSTGNTYCGVRLIRDGSTVLTTIEGQAGQNAAATDNWVGGCSTLYLDQPTSTPPLTSMAPIIYETQFISGANVATAYVQTGSSTSRIVLLEVVI